MQSGDRETTLQIESLPMRSEKLTGMHTLRDQYHREVKEMKTSQKSGVGTDDLQYLSRLWCYDVLAFHGDGDTPRDSTSNLDELQIADAAMLQDAAE